MEKVKKFLNENLFTVVLSALAVLACWRFVVSEEGRAGLYEILSLKSANLVYGLLVVFLLIKFLGGIDKNIKDDLFADKYTTTAFVVALIYLVATLLAK